MSRATVGLLLALTAAGCTRPASVGGTLPWLDGAVKVTAAGTKPRSEVSLTRGGALDPADASMDVMVNDATIALHTSGKRGNIDALSLTLDDIDLPSSADLPSGLQLRNISLSLDAPTSATVEDAEADTLVLSTTTPLMLHSSMVLSDGSLYPLGATATEPGVLTLRVTADGDAATATIDAAPPATCWSVGTPDHMLLQANNCAIFVESAAQILPL